MKHFIFLSQFDPNVTTNTEEKKQMNKTKHYNNCIILNSVSILIFYCAPSIYLCISVSIYHLSTESRLFKMKILKFPDIIYK